jgi:hypothetical protein
MQGRGTSCTTMGHSVVRRSSATSSSSTRSASGACRSSVALDGLCYLIAVLCIHTLVTGLAAGDVKVLWTGILAMPFSLAGLCLIVKLCDHK